MRGWIARTPYTTSARQVASREAGKRSETRFVGQGGAQGGPRGRDVGDEVQRRAHDEKQ